MKKIKSTNESDGTEAQSALPADYAPWLAELESRLLTPKCASHWPMVVIRTFPHHEGIFAYEFEMHVARFAEECLNA
jgi:hypothetical protein